MELEEVRQAVRSVAGTTEVAVTTYDSHGILQLVAFVASPGSSSTLEESLGWTRTRDLERVLPIPLIPQVFMVPTLERLPSGKLDLQAMLERHASQLKYDGPALGTEAMSRVERCLVGIWKQLLDEEHVRPSDNFFELGGHSLMATEVVALIEEEFSIEFPLRDFFDCETLADLAKMVQILLGDNASEHGDGEVSSVGTSERDDRSCSIQD